MRLLKVCDTEINMSDKPQELDFEVFHRENLLKLAWYLWNLPHNYEHFDMNFYWDCPVKNLDTWGCPVKNPDPWGCISKTPECGTVACAAGHGPAAGIEKTVEIWEHYIHINFINDEYQRELFWCFSGWWVDVDNTPKGAAKRIFYMLENPEIVGGTQISSIYTDRVRFNMKGALVKYKYQQPIPLC